MRTIVGGLADSLGKPYRINIDTALDTEIGPNITTSADEWEAKKADKWQDVVDNPLLSRYGKVLD